MKCIDCGNTHPALPGFPNHVLCDYYNLHMSNLADASRCEHFKAKAITNADRVRQMSDAEIEDWYWWMHKKMMQFTDSRIFVHEWLKNPVEVDNGT